MTCFLTRAVVTAGLFCTLMAMAGSLARAQSELPGCATCPGGSTEATIAVAFCSGGVNYNVNVTYCTMTYTPPATGLPCTPGVGINEYTVIKRICPNLTGLPPTDAATFKGTSLNAHSGPTDVSLFATW